MDYGRQRATQITGGLPEPASDRAPIDWVAAGDNTAQQLLYRIYKEIGAEPCSAARCPAR